jgi:hypothetical protein
MKTILSIALIVMLSGCSKSDYTYEKDNVIEQFSDMIVLKGGSTEANGPFKKLNGPTGHPNSPIEYVFQTSVGEFKVEHPSLKGYYMQIDGYENESGDVFWIILKMPNQAG